MCAWQTEFNKKTLSSADKIIDLLPSSGRLALGHAAAEPSTLVEALLRGYQKFQKLEITHMVPLSEARYCDPFYAKHFHHNALFVGASTRGPVQRGEADFTPVFFSEIPGLFRQKILPLDVALISVSPPDQDGWMSYGLSVDYTEAAATQAKLVIAEVNARMPYTFGSRIHVDQIDYFVPSERALLELHPHPIQELEQQIAKHCAQLIPDGACLQIGIGSIPDAVLALLHDKNDLGVHTEMFSDGLIDLVEQGNINGSRKAIDPGLIVATFLMGSQRLYDFVHLNPKVCLKPADYTNAAKYASQNDHLISINSAIQVDLFGQVCADMIGTQQYSSVGGQVDFVRATAQSRGGLSIIALPATAKSGTISRIVPNLAAGAAVTTSRFDVDTIVTEYGVAKLKGKTARERAESLIAIAHPDFRVGLRDSCHLLRPRS